MGYFYGCTPAHSLLWQQGLIRFDTSWCIHSFYCNVLSRFDLATRMALVPLVQVSKDIRSSILFKPLFCNALCMPCQSQRFIYPQEARGLDAGPRFLNRLSGNGDTFSAHIVATIASEVWLLSHATALKLYDIYVSLMLIFIHWFPLRLIPSCKCLPCFSFAFTRTFCRALSLSSLPPSLSFINLLKEKRHVQLGVRWFTHMATAQKREPASLFHEVCYSKLYVWTLWGLLRLLHIKIRMLHFKCYFGIQFFTIYLYYFISFYLFIYLIV